MCIQKFLDLFKGKTGKTTGADADNGGGTQPTKPVDYVVTNIPGVFTLENFLDFVKMKFSTSEDIQEMVLIGPKEHLDQHSSIAKLIDDNVRVQLDPNLTLCYIATVKNNAVTFLDVITSDGIDENMTKMLADHGHIVRVQRDTEK